MRSTCFARSALVKATKSAFLVLFAIPAVSIFMVSGCMGSDEEPAAPSGLTYSEDTATYTVGETIAPNLPEVSGKVSDYSVDPDLPPGLAIDPETGAISGTLREAVPPGNYAVTAANKAGSVTAVIRILTGNRVQVYCPIYPSITYCDRVSQNGSTFTLRCNSMVQGVMNGTSVCAAAYGCNANGCPVEFSSCLKGCTEFRLFE